MYKKGTTEKVGCTDGPVNKYLAALNANVDDVQNENRSSVVYRLPNFEYEWSEAQRYPVLRDAGKENWLEKANEGEQMNITQEMLPKIGNTTARSLEDAKKNFSNLEKSKQERFVAALKGGEIEMPIVIKAGDDYDLLGGNTRYTGLVAQGMMPVVWLINLGNTSLKATK